MGLLAGDGDLPGVDGDAHGPFDLVDRVEDAPVVQSHLGETAGAQDGAPGEEVGAGEAGDEGVRRSGDQLRGRPDLKDLAVDEDGHAVGEDRGVLEIVGNEKNRKVEVVENAPELGPHLRACVSVECREGLVQQEDVGPSGERASQPDALALPA